MWLLRNRRCRLCTRVMKPQPRKAARTGSTTAGSDLGGRRCGPLHRSVPESLDGFADFQRRVEDATHRNESLELVAADGLESGGGNAAAVLAIGFAAEL